MGTGVGIAQIFVTFFLPDWWPPQRLDYSTGLMNRAVDALLKLRDIQLKEWSKSQHWVTFELDEFEDFEEQCDKIRHKLDSYLRRYKEGRESIKL